MATEPDDDEDDAAELWKADGAGPWETWMQAQSEAHLFIQQLEAENKRLSERIAKALDKANTYRLMSRVWDQIQESLRQSRSY